MAKASEKKSLVNTIPGIGVVTAKHLRAEGYGTLEAMASASIAELCKVQGIGETIARSASLKARELLHLGWRTSSQEKEAQQLYREYITTSSNAVDFLLGGGIMTHAITELVGAYRTGKTQFCYQLAINAQLPEGEGGLGKKVAWIDTEKTYFPDRISQMAGERGLDETTVHDNILYALALTTDHQEDLTKAILQQITEENIGLLIIDSLVANYAVDVVRTEDEASFERHLGRYLKFIARQVFLLGIALVVTNHVREQREALFARPIATGGHILGHGTPHRLMLTKYRGTERRLDVLNSPNLPPESAYFTIGREGLGDVPGKNKGFHKAI